jgi:hypothetical protein
MMRMLCGPCFPYELFFYADGSMQAAELVEMICALHLTSYVDSPFPERGGLMLVGPPAVLKSTFIEVLDRHYPDALMVSDMNARSLAQLRDAISAGRIRTLVLPELAKLYERKEDTASNLEGTLRAMAAEGFQAASFEDSRVNRVKAHCMVMGAMTGAIQARHFTSWEETGFNRRFLWSLIYLEDPTILERAVVQWQRIDFQVRHIMRAPLTGEKIPNVTTQAERDHLRIAIKYQPGGDHAIQLHLLVKSLAVLRWWYMIVGDGRDPMQVIESFARSLGRDGVALKLDAPPPADVVKEAREQARLHASALARKRWVKKPRRKS